MTTSVRLDANVSTLENSILKESCLNAVDDGAVVGFANLRAKTAAFWTGILDDRGQLQYQIKLFAAMPLAALILVAVGVRIHLVSYFLPAPVGADLDVALTLLWLVGITAAFSILDHMDGLVSGVAAIASFFFTLLAILNGQMLVAPLGAAVFGASLGFLRWNFRPAKIFMGDGGAMFLGFVLAALGLKLRPIHTPQSTVWIVPIYGYSRDQRFDCKQVVVALVVTPEGFPLAYEGMEGNTSDRTTLRDFLDKIEKQYGKARRIWVMDRGIPTEAVLQEMRNPERAVYYLVGTPRSKIQQHEKKWLELPWKKVREQVEVKLFADNGELYVLAKSEGRQAKERAMRRKRLARLLRKLRAMRKSLPRRDQLLLRIGAAKKMRAACSGWSSCMCPKKARRSPARPSASKSTKRS